MSSCHLYISLSEKTPRTLLCVCVCVSHTHTHTQNHLFWVKSGSRVSGEQVAGWGNIWKKGRVRNKHLLKLVQDSNPPHQILYLTSNYELDKRGNKNKKCITGNLSQLSGRIYKYLIVIKENVPSWAEFACLWKSSLREQRGHHLGVCSAFSHNKVWKRLISFQKNIKF